MLHVQICCFVYTNRPLSISKNSLFQTEAKCKTSLVKMSFTLRLALKLRLGATRKWPIASHVQTNQPIRSITQSWMVTRHQFGISALVPRETSGDVAKYRLFSQATINSVRINFF